MQTSTDFDDAPTQSYTECYDCDEDASATPVYGYLLLEGGEIVSLCYEHWCRRQRAAQARMGEKV